MPVIAMDLGSCCEEIQDGQAGFLVDNVDEAVRAVEGWLESIATRVAEGEAELCDLVALCLNHARPGK